MNRTEKFIKKCPEAYLPEVISALTDIFDRYSNLAHRMELFARDDDFKKAAMAMQQELEKDRQAVLKIVQKKFENRERLGMVNLITV